MRGDADASQAFRNDARAQKNPAIGRGNRPLGVVATLARCVASRGAPRLAEEPICTHQIDPNLPDSALDQVFNSLDAQREACAAFIASQKHEGWACVPDRYDDGGISGATLDRPAM